MTPDEFWRLWRKTMRRALIDGWPSVKKLEAWIKEAVAEGNAMCSVQPPEAGKE